MAQFTLITVCFFLGLFFRIAKIFPDNTAQVLNRFIIYVSLPALTLKLLPSITLDAQQFFPISMAWILFPLGYLFFNLLGNFMKMSRATQGTLILTASLGNTSFVGFPLLEALFGASALATGIIVDQPGTFLVAGTLGVLTATLYSGKDLSWKAITKKLFTFPPFIAVMLAVLTPSDSIPETAQFVFDKLSQTLIPLSLLSVGFQLRIERHKLQREWKHLLWGLGFKLFLAPCFFIVLYIFILQWNQPPQTRIVLMESAMAPMITAGILATEYGLNQELSSLMVGVGIPLSLLTVPLWNWVLNFIIP